MMMMMTMMTMMMIRLDDMHIMTCIIHVHEVNIFVHKFTRSGNFNSPLPINTATNSPHCIILESSGSQETQGLT